MTKAAAEAETTSAEGTTDNSPLAVAASPIAAEIAVASITAVMPSPVAHAAACTAPSTDYGTVTFTASIGTAGTYRIWTRMSAPSASANTYLLEIDGNTCYIVGGSSVPVYSSGSSTRFQSGTTNWISKTTSGVTIDMSLTTGSHTVKLIGNVADVVVDRVIITADDSCTPTGVGDNCASIYLAPDIDTSGKVDFLDFSRLASKYGQTNGSLGRVDINGDGTVNFLDYSLLASKYGQ